MKTISNKSVEEESKRAANLISLLTNGVITIEEYVVEVDNIREGLGLEKFSELQRNELAHEYYKARNSRVKV